MCVYVRETSDNPLSSCALYPHAIETTLALRTPQATPENPSEAFLVS